MSRIRLRYINLDRATDRRDTFEASYAAAGFSDRWSMQRFAAIDAASERVKSTPGRQSDPYKGNFLSHVDCLRESLEDDDHLFVCEDDCAFSPETGAAVEQIIDRLDENSWDVLHTEVTLISAVNYPVFMKLYMLSGKRGVQLIRLNGFPYGYTGSSAYIVNRRSKAKVVKATEQTSKVIEHPFDIVMRGCIHFDFLNGFLAFPFLTAPSTHADLTQAPADTPCPDDPVLQFMRDVHLELANASRRLFSVCFDANTILPPHLPAQIERFIFGEREAVFRTIMPWMLQIQKSVDHKDFNQLQITDLGIGRAPGAT